MISVIVHSKRCLIFSYVILCGQLKRKDLAGACGSRQETSRIINELIDSGLLTSKKVLGSRIVRLQMPEAQKVLDEMDDVDRFYKRITEDHHFSMTPAVKGKRKLKRSVFALSCLMHSININEISLKYQKAKDRTKVPIGALIQNDEKRLSKVDPRGHVTESDATEKQICMLLRDIEVQSDGYDQHIRYEDRLKRIDKNAPHFFYSVDVKHYNESKEDPGTLNISSSRAIGHLIGAYNSYSVFYVESEKDAYRDSSERNFRNYIESKFQTVYGKEAYDERRKGSPKGECLIIYDNEEVLVRFVDLMANNNNTKAFPPLFYSKSYALPLFDARLNMMTRQDWKRKLTEQLFTLGQIESAKYIKYEWCDAVIDETPAMELVSMDLNKILDTKRILSTHKDLRLHAVCRPEDSTLIKRLYREEAAQLNIKEINTRTIPE